MGEKNYRTYEGDLIGSSAPCKMHWSLPARIPAQVQGGIRDVAADGIASVHVRALGSGDLAVSGAQGPTEIDTVG